MKTNRFTQLAIFVLAMSLLVAGCGAPTAEPTAVPTETLVVPSTPTMPAVGRINGRVEFQAPPSPASVLYVVNADDSSQWFSRELAGSEGPTPFEIEVPAGNYIMYARQADGPMAAAYLNGEGLLGTVTVPAGDVVNEVLLRFAAPQNLCQLTTLPASPDGRFAAIESTVCPDIDSTEASPTPEALGTIRGSIGYQAPPTPLSMLYFVSAERWYYLEVPGGEPVSTFEWQVAPGTYYLYAYIVGSESGSDGGFYRPSFAGPVTVVAGGVVENIYVGNINSGNCVTNPIPASPDGRFPALEASPCSP